MMTGRFPFSGGSVGSFVNHISPRCGLGMQEFLLIQGKMASGKFSPGFVFLDFRIAQAVVVGGHVGFERRPPLFPCLFQKQLVQERGLGSQLSPACLIVQVSETLGRQGEGAPLLNAWVSVRHSTLYHIIGMIIVAHPENAVAEGRLPNCARLGRARAPVPTRARQTRQATSLRENRFGLRTGNWELSTALPALLQLHQHLARDFLERLEHDAVHSAQDQLAAGVIKDLSRDRVQVNARLEASHRTQIQRQEIEEQGSIGLRGQRDHLALLLFGCFLEDELQVRRLAAQPGAVVDDLAVDLARCEVDETQKVSSETPAKETLANQSLKARASHTNPPDYSNRLLLVFIP